jgi:hypothetical protein
MMTAADACESRRPNACLVFMVAILRFAAAWSPLRGRSYVGSASHGKRTWLGDQAPARDGPRERRIGFAVRGKALDKRYADMYGVTRDMAGTIASEVCKASR